MDKYKLSTGVLALLLLIGGAAYGIGGIKEYEAAPVLKFYYDDSKPDSPKINKEEKDIISEKSKNDLSPEEGSNNLQPILPKAPSSDEPVEKPEEDKKSEGKSQIEPDDNLSKQEEEQKQDTNVDALNKEEEKRKEAEINLKIKQEYETNGTLPSVEDGYSDKYGKGSFGHLWRKNLLNTSNADWWEKHGERFRNIKNTNYIQSYEFHKLHEDLKDETDKHEMAQKLMELCEKFYNADDNGKEVERTDIWVYCNRYLTYEY